MEESTTQRTPAKSKRSANTRERIRVEAYRCFVQSGYHKTSVDNICKAAGISKGAFYWHFKSKDEVFIEILHTWAGEVEAEMGQRFLPSKLPGDPFEALKAALQAEVHRGRRIVPVWIQFIEASRRDERIRKEVQNFHTRIRGIVSQLMQHLITPTPSDEQAQAIGATVLGAFIGLVCQDLVNPQGASFERTISLFLDSLKQIALAQTRQG